MGLLDKLRRIAAPADAAAPARGAEVRLPGGAAEGARGPFWVRTVRVPLQHRHGEVELGAAHREPVGHLAEVARDPRVEGFRADRAVFFDTETTSLGGGAGTYVFLLGAGWFENGSFVVEQYFLKDITQEPALLDAVNRRFAGFSFLVSFYGKGFDAPRLLDRMSFHRMEAALPAVHLDLCLVGRSLFRGAFPDCRLQTFERELVRFARPDDLPGAECPAAFFDHLRGDSSRIPRVFEHNLHDILTLPAALARFARHAAAPEHPVVRANLGQVHESAGRDREARGCYTAALDGLRAGRHPLLPRVLERLALLERRAGRHVESARLLEERKDLFPYAFQPLEDLAKYYEHRVGDLPAALDTAVDARSRLVTGKICVDTRARQRFLRAVDHRLGRLRRRLDAAGTSHPSPQGV